MKEEKNEEMRNEKENGYESDRNEEEEKKWGVRWRKEIKWKKSFRDKTLDIFNVGHLVYLYDIKCAYSIIQRN